VAKFWNRSNFFINGEVGNRLNGIRETEIYRYSANKLTNWYVTEAGNLKAAKKYRGIGLVNDEILEVIDTRYNFFVAVTTKELVSFNKVTKIPISRIVHGLGLNSDSNISVFENQIFTSIETATGGYLNNVYSFTKDGLLGISNYLDTILTPLKEREKTAVDIYRVYNKPNVGIVLEKLSVKDDFIIKTDADWGIYLKDTGVKIQRLYFQYKMNVSYSDLTELGPGNNLTIGSTIAVMHNYHEADTTKSYMVGNLKVSVIPAAYDGMYGSYYGDVIVPVGTPYGTTVSGSLEYGEVVPLSSDIVDVAVIQNRLAMIKNDVIYFSKTFDYNNFRNGTKDEEGFYIKPSPIQNQQTKLLKMTAENILFVSSNKGIYAIGMDTTLTPANSIGITRIVSDTPSSKEIEIINNDLYYLSEDNILYCTQLFYTNGQAQMNNAIVEKYDITKRIKKISVGIIDNKTVLIATTDEDIILIYSSLDINIFRKFSLEFKENTKVFGFNKDLVSNKSFYEITDNNYKNTEIVLNPPAFSSEKSGSYLNDYESRIERVVLNVLNQDREAIKKVKINDNPLNNLGKTTKDYFSLYKYEGKLALMEGFSIDIETKENDKILEIRGIDTLVNVAGN
jgi:hypothetical protein